MTGRRAPGEQVVPRPVCSSCPPLSPRPLVAESIVSSLPHPVHRPDCELCLRGLLCSSFQHCHPDADLTAPPSLTPSSAPSKNLHTHTLAPGSAAFHAFSAPSTQSLNQSSSGYGPVVWGRSTGSISLAAGKELQEMRVFGNLHGISTR